MRAPRLAIDTEAGASRLSGGALQGPWQVPAELVRRALRAGARRVDVRCGDGSLRVADDGPPLDPPTRAQLAEALDPRADAAVRDRALAALEAGPHAELRYLAALAGARVAPPSAGPRGNTVAAEGLAWDADEARRWLRSVARFAGGRVWLDGEPLPLEPPACVAEAPLDAPRRGRLLLPQEGEDGALWLVEDGVVSAFLVAPSPLPFEAIVEMGGHGGPTGDGAALREAVAGDVRGLVDQAARLVLAATAADPSGDPARAHRLQALLLQTARLTRFRSAALHARAFPARAGGSERAMSLVELAAPEVQGPDRRIAACAPEAVADALFLSPRPALVLGAAARARLAQELGLRFRVLPRAERAAAPSWRRRVAAALAGLRARVSPARPLPTARWTPGERALVAALGGEAAVAGGSGPVRRVAGRLLLPRGNADVRAAATAVARDPRRAFAAALALTGTLGPESLRGAWRSGPSPVDSADQWRTA